MLAHMSPYLKTDRLAQILALIQAMGLSERYRGSVEDWSRRAFGNSSDISISEVRTIFHEHPEFFRDSTANRDHFALIARRALPRRWNTKTGELIGDAEYAALSEVERERDITRPRLGADQVNKLMDVAVTLHDSAFERHRDKRWFVSIGLSAAAALAGAIVGGLLRS